MLNISKHIMASNKADSSLSPPSPLNLITPFQFSLSSFLLLLYSIYLPPSSHLFLNSCSEVSFPSPRLHFLSCFPIFLFFSPPPLTQITDDPTCTCTKHTHAWKWLKAEMYTVHEPILGLNQHIHAVFFCWSMDRLGAWNENPLNRTFFTFPCILSQLGESLEFSKKNVVFLSPLRQKPQKQPVLRFNKMLLFFFFFRVNPEYSEMLPPCWETQKICDPWLL